MTKITLIVLLGVAMTGQAAQAAEQSILAFITEPQEVAVNVVSEKITVQVQDGSGVGQAISETGDVTLMTTSSTGEFSSNSTNWQAVGKVTMSKGTANRSFYYRDTAMGTYDLTAVLTFRTNGLSARAAQKIFVGTTRMPETDIPNAASSTSQGNPITTITASSTASSSEVVGTVDLSAVSAHDSPLPTSEAIALKLQLIVDAGRERVGVAHAPLTFIVSALDQFGKKVNQVDATWSFGDGTAVRGESVRHSYQYPGEYVIILNAQKGDLVAVDRTLVHIVPSHLAITRVVPGMFDDEVEVTNQGLTEVNLGGWSLMSGLQKYVFAPDTILLPGGRVVLPYATTKLMIPETSTLVLFTPDQKPIHTVSVTPVPIVARQVSEVSVVASSTIPVELAPDTPSLAKLESQLLELKKQIAPHAVRQYKSGEQRVSDPTEVARVPFLAKGPIPTLRAVSTSTTIVVTKKSPGFFANLMSLFK